MRSLHLLGLITSMAAFAAACSNSPDPRVIAGGGISDGEIDGLLNIYVIDNGTKQPIGSATVDVGGKEGMTDVKGLVVFKDLSGAQTIAVKAASYRSAVWVGANGANVTIPLTGNATPDQATLSGTITGWDTVMVPTGHAKAAAVFYSQTDDLGDPANNLTTPAGGNFCGVGQVTCPWTLVSRTGTVTVIAMILDIDGKGTVTTSDDVLTIIGWASKTGVAVEKSVNQSGLVLTQVEAGNLQNVTVDFGTPPAALTDKTAIIGIEVSDKEVIQIPLFVTVKDMALLPKPTVFGASATYRLTAVAQTSSMAMGAQSILLRRGLTSASLAAGTWLVPPTGVTASRTKATYDAIAQAKLYSIAWDDPTAKRLLEITVFDGSKSVDVPTLVALPSTGNLTAHVQGIGADIDVTNFSLDVDKKLLWGVSAEPVTIQ